MTATRDVVLLADRVLTMVPDRPAAEALWIEGERIRAVGPAEEVLHAAGSGAEVRHTGGTLLPAFIDPHHHFCMAAFDRGSPDLHLPSGASIAELLRHIAELVERDPGSGWLRAQGYDPLKLRERRAPTARELDEVCPDRPLLVIDYSVHEGSLNSAGLAAMGWDRYSPDPLHGMLRRARGRLTGEILEAAFFLAEAASRNSLLPTAHEAWLAEVEAHGHELLRHGIVRVGDAAVAPDFDELYEQAEAAGRLPVAVHRMPIGRASLLEPRVDGAETGAGPAGIPVGPAKLFLDGAQRCAVCMSKRQLVSLAAATVRHAVGGGGLAALRASARLGRPHRHADGRIHIGEPFYAPEELTRTVAVAARSGMQVAIHALGNHAVELACAALEAAAPTLDRRPGRPRLEHVTILHEGLERRVAASGAIAVTQPHFATDIGDELAAQGVPPGLRLVPLRSLLDAGVTVAGSSDYPVSHFDPLAAVRAAVLRRTRSGAPFGAEEAISVAEALRAYTHSAAAALGVEHQVGTLEPGKQADLVLLSADPLAIGPERLGEVRVRGTWRAGRQVFAADAPAA